MKKKEYYQATYMSFDINCGPKKPCYLGILSSLFERIQISKKLFSQPIGFHVRIRLRENVDIRSITDRLNKHYQLKTKHRKVEHTFKPLWVRVSEHDPDQDGYHHHLAIILDRKKARKLGLHNLFSQLKEDKFLGDYKIIPSDLPKYKNGVPLKDHEGIANYFYWLSYIAKSRTKENIHQTFSSSRLKTSA